MHITSITVYVYDSSTYILVIYSWANVYLVRKVCIIHIIYASRTKARQRTRPDMSFPPPNEKKTHQLSHPRTAHIKFLAYFGNTTTNPHHIDAGTQLLTTETWSQTHTHTHQSGLCWLAFPYLHSNLCHIYNKHNIYVYTQNGATNTKPEFAVFVRIKCDWVQRNVTLTFDGWCLVCVFGSLS